MNNIKLFLLLLIVVFVPGCLKNANNILKKDSFLPGPGIYVIKIDDSKNPYPTIRQEVKRFMTSLLASTPDCIEASNASQESDYVIQIQYQNIPGCDDQPGFITPDGAARHSLSIKILKTDEGTVLYEGNIEQNCTTKEFRDSLQSMLKDLIKKKAENTGRTMNLKSSFDHGDR